jgi:hypothetical protein
VPSLQLQHESSSVLLAGMENSCGGRSLSLSFRMESTTDGSRIPRLAEFARIKTNSSGHITPKAGWSIRLSQSKVVWWTRPGSNRRPPRCERGALPAELLAHEQPKNFNRGAGRCQCHAFAGEFRAVRSQSDWRHRISGSASNPAWAGRPAYECRAPLPWRSR